MPLLDDAHELTSRAAGGCGPALGGKSSEAHSGREVSAPETKGPMREFNDTHGKCSKE